MRNTVATIYKMRDISKKAVTRYRIIIMVEFQRDVNRLPGRLQDRCHVSCDVHSVAFSDVRHRAIVGTVPSSVLLGTEAETVKALRTVLDLCSSGGEDPVTEGAELLSTTVELAVTPLHRTQPTAWTNVGHKLIADRVKDVRFHIQNSVWMSCHWPTFLWCVLKSQESQNDVLYARRQKLPWWYHAAEQFCGLSAGIGVLIENGSYIYDDQTKAKILNDFYASVFITNNNVLPYSHSRVNDDCFICDVLFPPDRVFSLLTKLKPRTPDGLSAMFSKKCCWITSNSSITTVQNIIRVVDIAYYLQVRYCYTFITQKCIILHLGWNNTLHNYSLNNVSLPDVTVVSDLGVLLDNNLRFT